MNKHFLIMLYRNGVKKISAPYIFIFITSLFICLPLLLDDQILKANDLSGNLANIQYVKQTVIDRLAFPLWNPLVAQGIPIIADPLSSIYNPFFFTLFFFLPINLSIKVIYLLVIFLSGAIFYSFLRNLKIDKTVSFLTSVTYMSSGYLAARIFAGHIEKLLAYPLIALLLFALFKLMKKPTLQNTSVIALSLTLLLFSGSIYELLYSGIVIAAVFFILCISVFTSNDLSKQIRKKIVFLIASLGVFVLLSAVKLLPLLEIIPYILHVKTPLLGSQDFLSIYSNFFLHPKDIIGFVTEPARNTPYPWWEAYSFIGVIPLLSISYLPIYLLKKSNYGVWFLLFLIFIITLFAMLNHPLNPFYYLLTHSSFLQQFRIPSRVFIVLIPLFLALSALLYSSLSQKHTLIRVVIMILLLINALTTISVFQTLLTSNQPPYMSIKKDYQELIGNLKDLDASTYFISQHYLFQNQLPANNVIEENIHLLNTNYGFALKGSKSLEYINLDFTSQKQYNGIYPKYFIYPKNTFPPSVFSYTKMQEGSEGSTIYKNDTFTQFAVISSNPQDIFTQQNNKGISSITVEPNSIRITANTDSNGTYLTVLQSFSPGWKISVDGKNEEFVKSQYLSVKMIKGIHSYLFHFRPISFYTGAVITLLSFLVFFLLHIGYLQKLLKYLKGFITQTFY